MKKLLLFIALIASVGLYAQEQPIIHNSDFNKIAKSSGSDAASAGWIQKDLVDQGGSSTGNGSDVIKFDKKEGDGLYQEVAVVPGKDYVFTFIYNMKVADATARDSKLEFRILAGSGYVDGYSPTYDLPADIAQDGLGYQDITEVENAANNLSDTLIDYPGDDTYYTATMYFNSGTETSIAIFARGAAVDSITKNGYTKANGGHDIRIDKVSLTNVTPDDPSVQLSDLLVDDVTISNFYDSVLVYDVELAKGTTDLPIVTATVKDGTSDTTVTNITSFPGTATVLVTAASAETQTYKINFSVIPYDSDTTLSDLLVDDVTIDDFDPEVFYYNVELAEDATVVPTVTATTTEATADTTVTQAASLPGVTEVLVTAEDGSTGTYYISFTLLDPNAAVQPNLQNQELDSYDGWINKDLGDQPEESSWNSSTQIGLKFDVTESDLAYQEVAVVPNNDYMLVYEYWFDDKATVPEASSLEIRVLAGSGYDNGYTPTYPEASSAPQTGYGYTNISEAEASANNITSKTIAYPGDNSYRQDTIYFNAGLETSVAIFARGIGRNVTGTDGKGYAWSNGSSQVRLDYLRLSNISTSVELDNDTTLSALTYDGRSVFAFSSTTFDYEVTLPYGTTEVPTVEGTKTSPLSDTTVSHPANLPGTAKVLVTAEDGSTATYTISFSIATPDNDTTLSALEYNNTAISLVAGTFAYDVELAAGTTAIPVVTADANSLTAQSATVTQAATVDGSATVLVTAEDGSTGTYTINFSVAAASAISELDVQNLKVYTSNGYLTFECNEALVNGTLEVYELSGKLISSNTITNTYAQYDMQAQGMLIVKVMDADNNYVTSLQVAVIK